MITVTESAKEALKRISPQVVDQSDTVFRLIANKSGQLALIVDSERENDQLVKYQEATVLVIDREVSAAFNGVGIDYQDAIGGLRLFESGSRALVSNW
jgi:Fe-S cluster assembly iron-binding protein IscA